jgi:hypothetical protein
MDVWFNPVMVMEIKATDFLLSSLYTAGIDQIEKDRVSFSRLKNSIGDIAPVPKVHEDP